MKLFHSILFTVTQEAIEYKPSEEYFANLQKLKDSLGTASRKDLQKGAERLTILSSSTPETLYLLHSIFGVAEDQEIEIRVTYHLDPNQHYANPYIKVHSSVLPYEPTGHLLLTRQPDLPEGDDKIIETRINELVAKFII